MRQWLTLVFYFIVLYRSGSCACYLPLKLQGVYLRQRPDEDRRDNSFYDEVTVRPDSIQSWGRCISRQDKNVILEDSLGSSRCLRCYRLLLRTPNILQVYLDINTQCYNNEAEARRSCPFDEGSQKREITLFRRRGFSEDQEVGVSPQFCPLAGLTTFSYSINDGTEDTLECPSMASSMTDCPSGTDLEITFRQCTFGNFRMMFQCLGDWPGLNGERYIAFMDMDMNGDERRKLFRCGMYSRDEATQQLFLGLSPDSTCTNNLRSSKQAYETMILKYRPQLPWPEQVERLACMFPQWAWGEWESMTINNTVVVHKEAQDFLTYTSRCVQGSNDQNRFIVYSRTTCDIDSGSYNCLWIQRRADHVLEYKIGKTPSTRLPLGNSLCDSINFEGVPWNTQGRVGRIDASCPISGEYTGSIPDRSGLGATLISDCLRRDMMYYKVTSQNSTNRRNAGSPRASSSRGGWIRPYDNSRIRRQTGQDYIRRGHMKIEADRPIDILESTDAPTSPPPNDNPPQEGYDLFGYYTKRDPQNKDKQNQTDDNPPEDHQYRDSAGTHIDPYSFGEDRWGEYDRRPTRQDDRQRDPPRVPLRDPPTYSTRGPPRDPPTYSTRGPPRDPQSYPTREPPYYDYRDNTRYAPGRDLERDRYFPNNQRPTNDRDFYSRDSVLQQMTIKEEERTYRCLGAWEENGVLYTYTQRQDIPGYECFVGVVQNNDNTIQISEAGSDCNRESRSVMMQLSRQGPCIESATTDSTLQPIRSTTPRRPPPTNRPRPTPRTTTTDLYSKFTAPTTSTTARTRSTPRWRPSSRRSTWRPITARPNTQGGGGSREAPFFIFSLLLPLTMTFYHFCL